jgi:hypothetical protein
LISNQQKEVLHKDVQNIASKQIFFLYGKLYLVYLILIYNLLKKDKNCIFNFLTREFLQNRSWCHQSLKAQPPPTQTKPRFSKISKIPKPYKTLTSVISSAKPIKSWYEVVTKDEET